MRARGSVKGNGKRGHGTRERGTKKDANKGGKVQKNGCKKNQRRGKQREQRSGKQILNDPKRGEASDSSIKVMVVAKNKEDGKQTLASLTSGIPWAAGRWKGSRDIRPLSY